MSTRKPDIIDAQFNGWYDDYNIRAAFASEEAKELETFNPIFLSFMWYFTDEHGHDTLHALKKLYAFDNAISIKDHFDEQARLELYKLVFTDCRARHLLLWQSCVVPWTTFGQKYSNSRQKVCSEMTS